MIKLLHCVAIGALMSSALYAYNIKYETTLQGEQIQKMRAKIQKERENIAVLRAEWQHLNRPERLQALADKHLDLQTLQISQIVRPSDLPMRQPKADAIGQKLEALGLIDPDVTSSTPKASTPKVVAPKAVVLQPVTPRKFGAAKPGQPEARKTAGKPMRLDPVTPRPNQTVPPRPRPLTAVAPQAGGSATTPIRLPGARL
jgi:cell division protein FtsL